MIRRRDIEQTLEVFFVEGPMSMPDRVFDGVLDRVARTPQRRLARLQLRFSDMSTTARLLAAGAAAVLVVGVGFAAFGRGPQTGVGGPQPSTTASPVPSASAALPPVPVALRHPFLGAVRAGGAAPTGFDRSIIQLTDRSLTYNGTGLVSGASAPEPGTLRFESFTASTGCEKGDVGTYTYTLSAGENRMTVTPQADTCAARAAVLPGAWLRSACQNPDNFCLGPLEPGEYSSEYIDPFVKYGDPWQPRFGAISYTVPAGWANTADYPSEYAIARQGGGESDGIHIFSEIVIVSEETPCEEKPASKVGRGARAMADWLTRAPGVVATTPAPVTVGGLSGFRVDVSMDPDWKETCPFSQGKPARPLFTDVDPGSGLHRGLDAATRMRLDLLDLGDGRTMIIDIEGSSKAVQDAQIAEATAIVESFEFPH